jgi:capsular exopolysaccharide synthesis family protein
MNEKITSDSNGSRNASIEDSALPIGFDVSQIFNFLLIIKERWKWGLSVALFLSLLYAFVNLRKDEVYASTAYLFIDAQSERIIDVEEVVDTSGNSTSKLDNHLRQMLSRTFRLSVAETFTPKEIDRIQAVYLLGRPEANPPSIFSMLNRVTVNREGQVFSIRCSHHDPEAAAIIANRFTAQYITSVITRSGVGNDSALSFLEEQAEDLRSKIATSEHALTDYRRKYNLVSLEDSQNIIVDRLKSINSRKTAGRLEQLLLESSVDQVQQALESNSDLTEIPIIARYGTVPDILSRKKATEASLSELSLRYLERHPRIVEAQQSLEQINGQLEMEVDRAVRDLSNQKNAVDLQLERFNAELSRAEEGALALDQHATEYNVLKRQLDSDRQTFDTIINRLNETQLSSKLDTTNLRILDEALPAYTPIEPNKKKIYTICVFLFILGFFGVPIIVNLFDNRLKSLYDVEHVVGKPLLADLPQLKELRRGETQPNYVLNETDEAVLEAFRSAYSAIHLQSTVANPKVILVTSTKPGEGKSFVAANIAPTFARHGLKCLLVDTDLRRPVLHKSFNVSNENGILNWIRSKDWQSDEANILSSKSLGITNLAANFDFLPAGGSTKRTSEVIDSIAFESLMNAVRANYDVVVMDTPPSSLFSDAQFLSEHVDEVIYVAKYNSISRLKVRHFIKKLDGNDSKVLGLIINNRTSSNGQRYGYDYGYGYSSYSADYKSYQTYEKES